MKEELMLAKEFFRSISSGTRTGVLKFKNGDEAFINSKNLRTNLSGDLYTITVPIGFKTSIELQYNDDWQLIPLQQGNSDEWGVVSAKFDDMAYKVEQVADGKMKGYFYNAKGEKLLANSETVKLDKYFQTTRQFTIMGPKNVEMYYRVNLGSDICNHGQLTSLNLIDFIEEEDV